MRKDRWFRGALVQQQRHNRLTTAAVAAALLFALTVALLPQPAEAGGADCADALEALIDATIEVRFSCGREVWTDECRAATTRWFEAMDDYIECTAEPI